MVWLFKVAEFVNNNVILEFCGQKQESIVKIQIALSRAAPPHTVLVFNTDTAIRKVISLIPILETLENHLARLFAMLKILLAR